MTELSGKFARFRQGQRDAFEQIYDDLKKPVYTICLRILQSQETAEDVTHDVFVKLYLSPPGPDVKNPRAWVFQVAHNLAVDALRKQSRMVAEAPLEAEEGFDWVDARMDLEAAFRKLTREEREILSLKLTVGLSFHEVAGIMELSLPSVYRRYRKALKTLKDEWR